MRINIKLKSVDDAINFVDRIAQYDCDVDMISGSYYIDAKSMLGVIGVGANKEVILDLHMEESEEVKEDLKEFAA